MNNIPDQAWLKDTESRYILVNEAFMAACGRTEAEIIGSTPDRVWSSEWGARVRCDRSRGRGKRCTAPLRGEPHRRRWCAALVRHRQDAGARRTRPHCRHGRHFA
nr:PAS domain-containing protein [Pandoraea nosoerga]